MKYVVDTHTHTLASGHAYSTMREMAYAAGKRGLEALAITEHAPKMPGSCHEFYFRNMKVIPRQMCGVRLLLGTEVNISDWEGGLDLPQDVLKQMDIVLASFHLPCCKVGTREENTRAYLKVMENPYVDIIGHPDDARIPLDIEAVIQAAKKYHKLIEINNSSLMEKGARVGAYENQKEILKLCSQYQVMVALGSDAHVEDDVGNHSRSDKVLEETSFPEELIVNRSMALLEQYLHRFRNNPL